MKKIVALCLAGMLLLSMLVPALAKDLVNNGVAGVSAIAEVYTYHQIATFVIEYAQDVTLPEDGTYEIVDFAPSHMKELYDQRPFTEAVITAVYTNDQPDRREDKTSVPGRYVIIEQEAVLL